MPVLEEASLLPTARAQTAARYTRDGLLSGLSVGVRPVATDWSHLSPSEWEPCTLSLDLAGHHDLEVVEISLTDTPAQQGCQVRTVA